MANEDLKNELHKGHRARLKKRFMAEGIDNFEAHEVLELALFFAVPYMDTNPLAHTLINRFGSLSAVLDAPVEELLKVEGIGENSATLLKLLPALGRRYSVDRAALQNVVSSVEDMGHYFLPLFEGRTNEAVYMLCTDAKGKILGCDLVFEGSINSAAISVRKILANTLKWNASGVILAHNHPSGFAIPSKEDIASTAAIKQALGSIDVMLIDHIVVADDDFVSMRQSNLIEGK